MSPSLFARFLRLTNSLEGSVRHFYRDKLGLVTTGRGNLIDPARCCAGLVVVRPDGTEATPSEVSAYWLRCKGTTGHDNEGGNSAFWQNLSPLRVTQESLDRLFQQKADSNDAIMREWFGPDFDSYPENVRLALASMAWAGGAYVFRGFPHFTACVKAKEWMGAAVECKLSGVGIDARNAKNVALFLKAAAGGDPDSL